MVVGDWALMNIGASDSAQETTSATTVNNIALAKPQLLTTTLHMQGQVCGNRA